MRRALAIGAVLLLAGCGKEVDLKPRAGASLPPKAQTAATQPTANDLLTPGPEQEPKRVDELLTRSQPRAPDKFDMPPPG